MTDTFFQSCLSAALLSKWEQMKNLLMRIYKFGLIWKTMNMVMPATIELTSIWNIVWTSEFKNRGKFKGLEILELNGLMISPLFSLCCKELIYNVFTLDAWAWCLCTILAGHYMATIVNTPFFKNSHYNSLGTLPVPRYKVLTMYPGTKWSLHTWMEQYFRPMSRHQCLGTKCEHSLPWAWRNHLSIQYP